MKRYYLYRNAWRYEGAPDQETKLAKNDWQALLKQGGLLVRNTYDFDQQEESCFWYVIKDRFGGLEEFSSNERNKINRSTKELTFRKIDIELLKQEGWGILQATYADYAVSDRSMSKEVFLDYLESCEKQAFDYWGVYDKERLVGFCTVWLWSSDSCEYGLIGIQPEYKHNNTYPYYGLFYTLNAHYLGEKGFRYVADGARSITEHSHIQDFLIQNFLFRKAYCQLEVHYNRWMKLMVKALYPFRNIISLPRVKAILNMEAMQRGEK